MDQDLFEGRSVIQFGNEKDRRSFLKYAALVGVGGTLAATLPISGVFAASSPSPSPSPSSSTPGSGSNQFGEGDVGILNYALTLEYLESEFYQKGVAANILGDDAKYLTPIAAHEVAHVAALTATLTKLGATPATKPTFVFPPTTFTDKATFLKTAVIFEETGVKAYHGQVTLDQGWCHPRRSGEHRRRRIRHCGGPQLPGANAPGPQPRRGASNDGQDPWRQLSRSWELRHVEQHLESPFFPGPDRDRVPAP